MKIFKTFLALILASLVFIGCASIMGKSKHSIMITSDPSSAEITIENSAGQLVHSGNTPLTVVLKGGAGFFKGENYIVTFKKEGYAIHKAKINRSVGGWYIAGNLVFGGLIGWLIVDPATGAMWTLKDLHAQLDSDTSSLKRDTEIHIVTINEVPESLRSQMVRIQ